ncbi:M20/M25/M40 family metallo-hydrolase [Streptomyces sp. ISL-111]|uniref:M28 family metallopeptidase n=1 Tax=unclassified Streptomyces TaxID=2593676 RepID=UPI001BE8FAA2|nr:MULTISPECIES: M28 family metallopeptidase [unclassified Streptomyces]MBT2380556.1 M20/M25/M40 family metallo-hydrolase [Streptomyces sp. ISL-111]MBT2424770.1 M20/M25/M40 family metallo-hydrolase [Streptomyces sp. ISL-112]MBT2465969.1 M20/M25/M40 family metallo-hydrolase [Streptomyces sp. ISL-63]
MAVVAATALATPLLLGAAPHHGPSHGSGHSKSASKEAVKLSRELVKNASARDAYRHLQQFQAIADSAGGHRAAGSLGHDASAAYVHRQLQRAGYQVSYENFRFVYTETLAEKLSVVSPTPREVTIKAMTYTPSTPVGGLSAGLVGVPVDDTSGCEASDYASANFTGKIALIKRGGCAFAQKQAAAAEAGAAGAVIYNNTEGVLSGTLGEIAAGRIPTGGVTQEEGEQLAADLAGGEVTVSFEIRELQEERATRNVIAETRGGEAAKTVMLGAHLDSVTEGPGINDNGSGSAGLLEVALELAKSKSKPANKVRFAWWSAEENGLLGSEAYVAGLSEKQREQIALYLNFDMIASPNGVQFVYDGDDSDGVGEGPGPEGSAQLERDINEFLDGKGKKHEGTDFTGRSDYGPFIEVGIPSGGTFTGAEGIKTATQARTYGGEAGVAYDPCYHEACDDLSNISMRHFDLNIDVIADAVGTYAHDLRSLTRPVTPAPSTGTPGSGGGLHDGHGHEVTE